MDIMMQMKTPADFAKDIRKEIIRCSRLANIGHIGSALSIADIIAVLYGQVFPNQPANQWKFILSKGHAALALYAALVETSCITREQLEGYCQDNTLLGTHPDHRVAGIELSTGSLGMGLGTGAGYACYAKIKKQPLRVYVLLSDGECDEGSVWESAMFAGHQKLDNLVAIIDYNHQQAMGTTGAVLSLDPLSERWKSFGWIVHTVDGHDLAALAKTFAEVEKLASHPQVIIANTVSGHGISYMENQVKWHYLPMSEKEYRQALEEIESSK